MDKNILLSIILLPKGQGKKLENIGQDGQLLKLLFWNVSLDCNSPSTAGWHHLLLIKKRNSWVRWKNIIHYFTTFYKSCWKYWWNLSSLNPPRCVFICFFCFLLFYFKFYMLGDLLFSRIIICFSIRSEVFDSRSFGKRNIL